ncbi:MAG TPA: hypothetical protein VM537_10735 [Anaerolineae bacterium]|nr:hypothetical protein [Anaerolineae bacterium]
MFLTVVLVAVLAFILGALSGFGYMAYGLLQKAKTEDLIKGQWVKRKFNAAEMMFGKDE